MQSSQRNGRTSRMGRKTRSPRLRLDLRNRELPQFEQIIYSARNARKNIRNVRNRQYYCSPITKWAPGLNICYSVAYGLNKGRTRSGKACAIYFRTVWRSLAVDAVPELCKTRWRISFAMKLRG